MDRRVKSLFPSGEGDTIMKCLKIETKDGMVDYIPLRSVLVFDFHGYVKARGGLTYEPRFVKYIEVVKLLLGEVLYEETNQLLEEIVNRRHGHEN